MKTPEPLSVDEAQLEGLSTRLDQDRLEPADREVLKAALNTLIYLRCLLEQLRDAAHVLLNSAA